MPEKKEPRPDRFLWEEGNLEVSQYAYCKHKRPTGPHCNAFPEGIPLEILRNDFDHREPHEGDRGICFERRGDL